MSLSTIAKRLLNDKIKKLHKAGYISDDLKITDAGRIALEHVVFEANEDKLVAMADEKIAREAEEKKK